MGSPFADFLEQKYGKLPASPAEPVPASEPFKEFLAAKGFSPSTKNLIEVEARGAADVAPLADLDKGVAAFRKFAESKAPAGKKAIQAAAAQKALKQAAGVHQTLGVAKALAGQSGDPELQANVEAEAQRAQRPESYLDRLQLDPLGTIAGTIDYPAKQLRRGIQASLTDKTWEIATGDPTEFNEDLERLAAERTTSGQRVLKPENIAASGFVGLSDVVGAAAGAPLGLVTAAAAELGENPPEGPFAGAAAAKLYEALQDPERRKVFIQTLEETMRDSGRTVRLIGADPLNALSAGSVGTGKTLVSQFARMAKIAKLDAKATAALIRDAEAAVKLIDTVDQPELVQLAKQHGIADEAIAKVIGERAQHAGVGQLEVGVPFLKSETPIPKEVPLIGGKTIPALSTEILPKLGIEQPFRKAVEAVGEGVQKLGKGRVKHVYDPVRNAVKRQQGRARAVAMNEAIDSVHRFRDDVAQLAPADPRRREQIVKEFIDPDYEAVEVKDVEKVNAQIRSIFQGVQGGAPAPGPLKNPQSNVRYYIDTKSAEPRLFEVKQTGKQLSPWDLNQTEQQWVSAIRDHFAKEHTELVAQGLLKPGQRGVNWWSGQYLPRRRGIDEFFFEEDVVGKIAGEGKGFRHVKPRGEFGGQPAGRDVPGTNIVADPHELVISYSFGKERLRAMDDFSRWMADNIAEFDTNTLPPELLPRISETHRALTNSAGETVFVPAEYANQFDDTFKNSFASIGQGLRNAGVGRGAAGRSALKIVDLMEWATDRFRRIVLLPVPRYHIVNQLGDSTMMAASGFKRFNPAYWDTIDRLVDDAIDPNQILGQVQGKTLRARDIRVELQQEGLIGGDAVLEFGGGFRGKVELQKAAEQGALARGEKLGRSVKARRFARKAGAVADAPSRAGEALASWWDTRSKAAYYLDRRLKGDPAQVAAKKTFEVLFDYSDRSQTLRFLRVMFPFATWQYKALTSVPRIVAKNPGAALWSYRVSQAFGKKESERNEAPRFLSERGHPLHLKGAQLRLGNVFQQLAGGRAFAEGEDPAVLLRDPITEGYAPVLNGLVGNSNPLKSQLGPPFRQALEAWTGVDPITGEKIGPRSLRPLPAGTPIGPSWLQADSDEVPFLAHDVAPYLVDPGVQLGLSMGVGAFDENAPPTILGASRPYAFDADQRRASSLINYLTGFAPYETSALNYLFNRSKKVEPKSKGAQKLFKARMKERTPP